MLLQVHVLSPNGINTDQLLMLLVCVCVNGILQFKSGFKTIKRLDLGFLAKEAAWLYGW